MEPIVSIIMGSTSDLPVMEKAAKLLDEMHVPFETTASPFWWHTGSSMIWSGFKSDCEN